MRALIALLRDVVWSAVVAVALALAGVVVALVDPLAPTLPLSLGAAAVTLALLASRS